MPRSCAATGTPRRRSPKLAVVGGDIRPFAPRQFFERISRRTAERRGLEHGAGLAAAVVVVAERSRDPSAAEREQRGRGVAAIPSVGTRAGRNRHRLEVLAHVIVELIRERDGAERGAEPRPLRPLRVQRGGDVVFDVGRDGCRAPSLAFRPILRLRVAILRERCRADRRRGERDGGV